MKALVATVLAVAASALGPACGDDDCCAAKRDAAPIDMGVVDVALDALPSNPGFVAPPQAVGASIETMPGEFQPTTLDLSCNGVARSDTATTTTVSLALSVEDFQSGNIVPSATVELFNGYVYETAVATATTDGQGEATVNIPSGTGRHGFRTTQSNARATYTLDLLANPTAPNQTRTLTSMSNATIATLPALVGRTQMQGRATVLGQLFDCAGNPMRDFIATISTTAGSVSHLPGALTFYFDAAVGLPVSHSRRTSADADGRFMVIDVMETAQVVYVQMWGFASAADFASKTYSLLAELPIRVLANGVFIAAHDPRKTF